MSLGLLAVASPKVVAEPLRRVSQGSNNNNNKSVANRNEEDDEDMFVDDLAWLDECLSGDFMDFISEDDFAMLANEKGKW